MIGNLRVMTKQRDCLKAISEVLEVGASDAANRAAEIGQELAGLGKELTGSSVASNGTLFALGLQKVGELAGQEQMLKGIAEESAAEARLSQSRAREMDWGGV